MPNDTAPAWPDPAREAVEWALAVHFTQNRQPCMSGDPRDRLSSLQRRNMEDARDAVLGALAPLAAAREAAAFAAGAEAMREMAAADVDWTVRTFEKGQGRLWQEMGAAFSAQADEIRALPLPPMPAQPQGGARDAG